MEIKTLIKTIYMKHFLLIFVILFISCSGNEDLSYLRNKTEDYSEYSVSINITAIRNYIDAKYETSTRVFGYCLTPILNDNDTVMYLANYGDDDGWEIFSNSKYIPMVLFSSPKGHFDITNISNNNPIEYLIDNC